MSEFMKISAGFGARFSRVLSSWVNLNVKEQQLQRRDTALFGLYFSLPAVSLASMVLQTPLSALGSSVSTIALAFSLPILAAAYLSLTGSKTARSGLTAIGLPAFYLAATQATGFYVHAALIAGMLAGTAKKEALFPVRELAIGAAGATAIAFSGGFSAAAVSALFGLLSFAITVKSTKASDEKSAKPKNADLTTVLPMITGKNGFLFEVDRKGKVFGAHGILREFKGVNLSDVLHVADRVGLLTILDGLEAGLMERAEIEVRLTNPGCSAFPGYFGSYSLQLAKFEGRILIFGNGAQVEDEEETREIAPIATVCHEMRTPLNAIIGFSEMLENGLAGALANERQSEYAGLINRSGKHLLDVVNSFLVLAAAENNQPATKATPFLPDEVAMFSIKMLAEQAKAKGIGLDYTPSGSFEPFIGDRLICQQILVNLLSNAVKYTEAGGSIKLVVDLVENGLKLEVSDSGVGMAKPDLARAGIPYFRVVRAEETSTNSGTGLGLALVRNMTKLHGGSMEIESSTGEGTRVRVVLRRMSAKEDRDGTTSILLPAKDDESAKLIYLSEETFDEAPRKTA